MKQKRLFSEVLATVTKYFLILVIIVILGIFCSGIRIVETGNVALILRFGQLVGDTPQEQIHEPGLLLAFPYIIDEVIMVPADRVMEQNVTTYYTEDGTSTKAGGYLITLGTERESGQEETASQTRADGVNLNVVLLSASVKYVVSDPVAYALRVEDVESVINACVSSSLLTQGAQTEADSLLTGGKEAYAARVMTQASRLLEENKIGVRLTAVELTQVSMPSEVREVYDQVTSASIEANTILENARSHVASLIPYAQGIKAKNISEANTEKANRVAAATQAMTEFWGVLEEYKVNPAVVKTRIYAAKLAQIMEKIGTVRIVQDGQTKIILSP